MILKQQVAYQLVHSERLLSGKLSVSPKDRLGS